MTKVRRSFLLGFALLLCGCAAPRAVSEDPLPSWREGPSKQRIVEFVAAVTDSAGSAFVAEPARVAVFDNDGTLWSEQPLYFQLVYVLDRVRAMAPDHPEWQHTQPFQAALEGDMHALAAQGEHGLIELLMATHSGMTVTAFAQQVSQWLDTARHPRFDRPYTDLVYQPMLELISYLERNGFSVFIVSGGGMQFMRPWTESVYGIPPERVVGSSVETRYAMAQGEPVILMEPEIHFIDDKAGKPVGINRYIGRRPILAFGNSDGDFEMLQWTTAGDGRRLGLILHHTDGEREWAYDRDSHIGRLDRALERAAANGWVVVDMARDWRRVYPFDRAEP